MLKKNDVHSVRKNDGHQKRLKNEWVLVLLSIIFFLNSDAVSRDRN